MEVETKQKQNGMMLGVANHGSHTRSSSAATHTILKGHVGRHNGREAEKKGYDTIKSDLAAFSRGNTIKDFRVGTVRDVFLILRV